MRIFLALALMLTGVAQAANLSGTASASSAPKPNESAAQAFDASTATKWLGGVTTNTWLQLQLAAPSAISGYAVTSANDAPERDPRDVVLEGSNDGATWTALDAHTFAFTARFQKQTVTIGATAAYVRYRLRIVANNGSKEVIASGTTGLVQLAELELVQSSTPAPPPPPVWSEGTQTLTWTAPTLNTDGTAISTSLSYRVEQALSADGPWSTVANLTATSYTATKLAAGIYYWRVFVTGGGSESVPTLAVSGTVTEPTTPPPPPPPPAGPKVVAVVAGLNMSPVFGISSSGARGTTVLGFVPVGKTCIGTPVYTYRGQSYYRFTPTDAVWWQSSATSAAAVACK